MLAATVRHLAESWVGEQLPEPAHGRIQIGLPEWDDRYDCWRIALVHENSRRQPLGELRIDDAGAIQHEPTPAMVLERMESVAPEHAPTKPGGIVFPPVPNKLILGDCREALADFPADSVQLIFTSPPYFNAKPEYVEYRDYPTYLEFLRQAFAACRDVLAEGRFLIVNVSPVLVRRTSRSTSSRRMPIPFDLHGVLAGLDFEFVDDIIWRKPDGAGWHLGRGRRFAADRQPLQYKPVTVTEYVLVYRKKTDRLIDWNLRHHPDPEAVRQSLIGDDYAKTNVWEIAPSAKKGHPAIFPDELADRVIRYYSFVGDLVLDPFAGSGTVGRIADALGRRYVLIEKRADYFREAARGLRLSTAHPVDIDDLEYRWCADDA